MSNSGFTASCGAYSALYSLKTNGDKSVCKQCIVIPFGSPYSKVGYPALPICAPLIVTYNRYKWVLHLEFEVFVTSK